MKKFYRIFNAAILLLFPFFTIANSQTSPDPAQSLPQTLDGWSVATERTFNDSTLYDYIDGGAELYLSFGFSKVYNRIYSRQNQPDILIDLFYMNSPRDAFGVFSFSVGKEGTDFGVQSQIANGAIIFWKNNYYVSISCYPETNESKATLNKFAQLIDGSILQKGEFPEILKYLPPSSLNKESIRYFRHYIWLNSHMFISNENILNINQNTEAVLARYGDADKSILLIVKYPNNSDMSAAKEKFIQSYNHELVAGSIVKMPTGKWCGIESTENFFVAVFNGSDKEAVSSLINQAKGKIKGSTTPK